MRKQVPDFVKELAALPEAKVSEARVPRVLAIPMQDRRRQKAYPRLSYPAAFLAGALLGVLRSVRGRH